MAILTTNHNINQVNAFIQDISDTRHSFYVFASKPLPWKDADGNTNESIIIAPNNSTDQIEQVTYDEMLFGKLLTSSDVMNLIPRHNWASGTVYTAYSQTDANQNQKPFYVVNDSEYMQVFKCLYNNGNSPSTVMPRLTATAGSFSTGDGYIWKYMYSIDSVANSKFTSTNYLPVAVNTAVSESAVPGTIDAMIVTNGGSNYQVFETGFIAKVIDTHTIQLPLTSSPLNNYYAKSSIYLKAGFGAGQIRQIRSSNGASKQITVSANTPFAVFERLDLKDGSFVGDINNIVVGQIVSQPIDYTNYLYGQGYINAGDTIVQSDSFVTGTILTSNSSAYQINRTNQNILFNVTSPIRSTVSDGVLKSGNVIISNVGGISFGVVLSGGSGYTANATVTITANGSGAGAVVNAHANTTGKIDSLLVSTAANGYLSIPTVTIDKPSNTAFFTNSSSISGGSSNGADSNSVITISSAKSFVSGDALTYYRQTSNTANIGLVAGTTYYIQFANNSVLALANTVGGSRITLNTSGNETGHSLQGYQAFGVVYPDNFLVTNASSSSGTSLDTDYANGDYIRVGSNANSNFRHIVSVNSSVIIVDQPFVNSLTNAYHYSVPNAAELVSISSPPVTGVITDTNLYSRQLDISDLLNPNLNYFPGEKVDMVSNTGASQGASAIVAYSNSSTVYIAGVTGTWISSNTSNYLYIKGESSQQTANINLVTSNPNVTIKDPVGEFVIGRPIYFGSSITATLNGSVLLPSDQTEYVIGPTISVEGDGYGVEAIGIVNTAIGSGNTIIGVEMIASGKGYTTANVSVISNTSIGGSGYTATLAPVISPLLGHGYDPITELGGIYAGVNIKFDTAENEQYYFPVNNEFRKIGIIQDPQFNNVLITVNNFDRVNFVIHDSTSSYWVPNEVVVQSSTNAAGVVVYGNSTFLQIKNAKGTFEANSELYGYYSNTTANVTSANTIYFQPGSNGEIVSEVTSGAKGTITAAFSNTSLLLSNVYGQFVYNDVIYDSLTNAYATVTSIATSNGARDATTSFGKRFNQTLRLSLYANTGAFTNTEIVQQDVSGANGRIISATTELDLAVNMITGTSFYSGQVVTDAVTGANGTVLYANSTYIKLTNVNQDKHYVQYHTINSNGSETANVQSIYTVLLLNDINGTNQSIGVGANVAAGQFQGDANLAIIGLSSGSYGFCNNPNNIVYPDLVRDTGKVIYLETFAPVQRSITSNEEIKIVIKF